MHENASNDALSCSTSGLRQALDYKRLSAMLITMVLGKWQGDITLTQFYYLQALSHLLPSLEGCLMLGCIQFLLPKTQWSGGGTIPLLEFE